MAVNRGSNTFGLPLYIPSDSSICIFCNTEMDKEHFTQDRFLHSTSALSTVIDSFESSNVPEFHSLKDGLTALQDTLWASRGVSDPTLPVFYVLCSTLCDVLSAKLSNCHSLDSNLKNVLVLDHDLSQISRRLRNLFHALTTFLSMRFQYVKTVIFMIYMLIKHSVLQQNY